MGGRYRLLEQIGAGGMAPVWRAHDDVLDRAVAVKVLTEDASSESDLRRAQNEARSAACLAHPNVAAVYDFGTTRRGLHGAAYVVMELVDGPLLSQYLQDGPVNWRFATRIGAEVAAGLAAAHALGIVHRDVKPSNVVLTPTGAKLLDFGIAAKIGEVDQDAEGNVEGTVAYMAPERQFAEPVAPALDLYALGVMLYRTLTARLPWQVETTEQMWAAHRVHPPDPLPEIEGLAPEVAEICRQCLDKDPAARPTALAAALLLAASVQAQVYVPTLLDRPRPAPASPASPLSPAARAPATDLDAVTVEQRVM